MATSELAPVLSLTTSLRELLDGVPAGKLSSSIDQSITTLDDSRLVAQIQDPSFVTTVPSADEETNRTARFAIIETSIRNVFNGLLTSTSIDDPSFSKVWNLLDVVSIISDNEQCESALIFWLIEELLDSQTIDGCQKVFDYLESRRERLTARHFKNKQLVILRSCNELLRRLSRAENTVFCGRVFFFLFQSFPLGDKSSVNLRGEYHVENLTTFDDLPPKAPLLSEQAISENKENLPLQGTEEQPLKAGQDQASSQYVSESTLAPPKAAVTNEAAKKPKEASLDYDTLYPIFWSLQRSFSNPTRLFETSAFDEFKEGLRSTIAKFEEVQKDVDKRGALKASDESRRGVKRKRGDGEDELATSFNPKYLTSRDLFELEVSDLAFRRHILVQALILVDFLLSLTVTAKKKLADLNIQNRNRSVLYQHTLSDEQAEWVINARETIERYLQAGPEGRFYHRMVDTVLSRDKNWARWKVGSCPPIGRPPVATESYQDAKSGAKKLSIQQRLKAPLSSMSLDFLTEAESGKGYERLKDAARVAVPELSTFEKGIQEDELDLEMAADDAEKESKTNAKASKTWRALRAVSKQRLKVFDDIDDQAQKLQPLFKAPTDVPETTAETNAESITETSTGMEKGNDKDEDDGDGDGKNAGDDVPQASEKTEQREGADTAMVMALDRPDNPNEVGPLSPGLPVSNEPLE